MKKSIFTLLLMLIIISLITIISCATQLPAFDSSLPNSETAILVIPKHIYIITIDGESAGWENGQVRIPIGRRTFTLTSEENIMVPLGYISLFDGTNYTRRKTRMGPYTISHTFEAGKTYRITSERRWDGRTFASQYAAYTISPPSGSSPQSTNIQQILFNPDNIIHEIFFGLWKNEGNAQRIISEREITIRVDNMRLTFRLDNVTPVENPNVITKIKYPNGFMFSGVITACNYSSWGTVGDIYTRTFYLHTDKNSISEGSTYDSHSNNIYIKQE